MLPSFGKKIYHLMIKGKGAVLQDPEQGVGVVFKVRPLRHGDTGPLLFLPLLWQGPVLSRQVPGALLFTQSSRGAFPDDQFTLVFSEITGRK